MTSTHTNSWYAQTANDQARHPALAGCVRADVAVIGAGFTGLSAALELAQRGFRVAVVEAERVGWGASGRNGGLIGPGYVKSPQTIAGWMGTEDTRRLISMSAEANRLVKERIDAHAIECDWKPGYLYAAVKPRHLRELDEERQGFAEYGYDGMRMLDRDETAAMVRAQGYLGGLFDPRGAHFHPLNYALGLARAAVGAGAQIFEESRVVSQREEGGRVVVETAGGRIEADWLILAGNALLGGVEPRIRSRIMPVGTYIIATEPLGEAAARELIPGDICVADINFVLNYYRLSSDHRMLFGGGVCYSGIVRPDLTRALRAEMLRWFPQLRGAKITHTWLGQVDITLNRMPHFGRLGQRTLFAQGFSGHGAALTGLAGRLMAETVAGQAERFDVISRLPHMPFPGGELLRTPALVLAMAWMRFRDLL